MAELGKTVKQFALGYSLIATTRVYLSDFANMENGGGEDVVYGKSEWHQPALYNIQHEVERL